MAVRELFAVFGFEWDKPALNALTKAVDKAEKGVEQLAKATKKVTAVTRTMATGAKAAAGSTRTLSQVIRTFHGQLSRVNDEGDEAGATMRELGVNTQRLAASGRSATSVWNEMIGRLAKVTDEAKRAKMAIALLGEEGARAAAPALAGGIQAQRTRRRGAGRPVAEAPPPATVNAWQRLATRIRGASAATRKHREETAALRQQAGQGITGGLLQAAFWQGLAAGIANAWRALIRFAGDAVVKVGGLVAQTTVWADSTQKALGMISGFGIQTGVKEFEEITRTAAKLGLNVLDATDSFKRLRAVGFGRGEAKNLVSLAADMQAGLGLTEETVKRVFLALGQIKGAGKLQGDELRQLQETGLSIDKMWASIAEQMGVTVEEARKLKEAGEVSADVAIKAVEEAVLGTLGTGTAGKAAEKLKDTTFRGMIAGAKGSAQLWFLDLIKELNPRFEELAGRLGGTFDKLQKSGKLDQLLTNLQRLVEDTIDLIIIRWPEIEAIVMKVTDAANADLSSLILALDDLLGSVIETADFIVTHWDALKTMFVTASAVIVAAITAIGIASTANAIKVIASFGGGVIKAIKAFRATTVAANTTVAASNATAAASFGRVAIAAGSVAAAIGSIALAWDQFAKLSTETKAEGGILQAIENAGGWGKMVGAAFGGEGGRLGGQAKIGGKAYNAPTKPLVSPVRPATMGLPMMPSKPTAFNDASTTNINVTGASNPVDTARAIGNEVGRRDRARRNALHGALAGVQYG